MYDLQLEVECIAMKREKKGLLVTWADRSEQKVLEVPGGFLVVVKKGREGS